MELKTVDEYKRFIAKLKDCKDDAEKLEITRYLCRTDLFFLLWYGCSRKDIAHPWLLGRCQEVQASPDGHLDLWAREHYKSTIITYGKTIQDILASHGDNPLPVWQGKEPTIGLFSCTRPLAKGFLRQIKFEFESNQLLKELFPDVIWARPQKDAPKWSEDDGLVLKRKSNPKENTIEAWGLVEGQPTGKHFDIVIYDDVVTLESVTTPDMIKKTTDAWAMSINLGAEGGRRRYIGTRYHANDTYREIIKRNIVTPRIYAATLDGSPEGEPVLLNSDSLAQKRRSMGNYIYACQMLQNPVGDETQGFKKEWIKYHQGSDGEGLNRYILIDPANEKKKASDYTAMAVIGLGSDENYYLLDMVRDRLNLTERGDYLFRLHKKWRPLNVGYEKYGMQADVQYMKERMNRENYHFNIIELGGKLAKNDRIKRLIPLFQNGRFYFPETVFRTLYDGKVVELVEQFINEEYEAFPVPVHDDMLDCMARVCDEELGILFPRIHEESKDRYSRYESKRRRGSAWSA